MFACRALLIASATFEPLPNLRRFTVFDGCRNPLLDFWHDETIFAAFTVLAIANDLFGLLQRYIHAF